MKICLMGYFRKTDEGMANSAFNLSNELSEKYDVLKLIIFIYIA